MGNFCCDSSRVFFERPRLLSTCFEVHCFERCGIVILSCILYLALPTTMNLITPLRPRLFPLYCRTTSRLRLGLLPLNSFSSSFHPAFFTSRSRCFKSVPSSRNASTEALHAKDFTIDDAELKTFLKEVKRPRIGRPIAVSSFYQSRASLLAMKGFYAKPVRCLYRLCALLPYIEGSIGKGMVNPTWRVLIAFGL